MLHLFDAEGALIRKKKIGTEDGTPIYGEETVWTGACRKDDPSEMVAREKVATKVSQMTTIFTLTDCPADEDDFFEVTNDRGTKRYRIDSVTENTTPFVGMHHLEITADRVAKNP